MSFDMEPDGDPHGECALEIHSLQERLKVAEQRASEFERQTMAQVERTKILFDGKNRIIEGLRAQIKKLEEIINYKPLEMKIPDTASVSIIEDDSRMAIEFGHEFVGVDHAKQSRQQ